MTDPVTLFLLTNVTSTIGFIIASILLFIGLLLYKPHRTALLFLMTSLGLMVSTTALKQFFQVARPLNPLIEVSGYAFPSGHASGALFLGFSLCFLLKELAPSLRYSIYFLTFTLVLIIGISRIVYNVHTPMQVIAGYGLGAFWAIVFIYFDKKQNNFRRNFTQKTQ